MQISVEALLGVGGFLLQLACMAGAIVFSHGQLAQRVRNVEKEAEKQSNLATSVARLEAELEAVGREIKGLREDFRRVLDEFTRRPMLLRDVVK